MSRHLPSRRTRGRASAVTVDEFEELVRQALDTLPPDYAQVMKNVAVMVEEEPPRDVLDDLGLESEDDLLGLYVGNAGDDEAFFAPGGTLPDRIYIYRGPILRLCRTRREVIREVRETVVHEIGHHFGLSDDDMPF